MKLSGFKLSVVGDLFESVARWADRHSPQTLFARALIIIVVPMLLLQALSAWWFYSQRGDNVTNRLALILVRDLRTLISLRADFPDDEHKSWIMRHSRTDMLFSVAFHQGTVRPFRPPEYFDIVARELQGALDADLRRPYFIDNDVGGEQVLIEIQLTDSDVMEVLVPYVRLTFGSSFAYVLAQVGLSLVLFGLAIWFMRRELVPIEHLGVAADALGKGRDVPDFAFSGGTREVRNAATAFQTMRIRLQRSLQQRTEMLAGVSHDLRTPLTRMKLSLALLAESPETRELGDDVVDMERMIEGYLAFARGEGDEDPIPSDLAEILQDVAAGARRDNADVAIEIDGDVNVELRPFAMKRCLTNLVSNALRHATKVELRAVRGRTSVEITVDDDGPGIPPDKYEDVFRPFLRLDESRNVDTGGVGLGLTIARDIARSHGGDVTLAPSPLGGLRVIVRIPI
jgi:two-component system, OmpR family, osmolarity sensor histidine kinase EnvZ